MSESPASGADLAGPASSGDAGPAGPAPTGASPFARYPRGGREPLGRLRGANARREYGRQLHLLTGERCCASCGLDLYARYENWLLLQVDNAGPAGTARLLGIPAEFSEVAIDLVLARAGCNGFDNRYVATAASRADWDLAAFLALRDATFAIRSERIAARRVREHAFFAAERASLSAPDAPAAQTS